MSTSANGCSEKQRNIEKKAQLDLGGEDEKLARELFSLQRQVNTPQINSKIKEIGEYLCANGGDDRMQLIAHRVAYLGGSSRQLEWDWSGICGWQP